MTNRVINPGQVVRVTHACPGYYAAGTVAYVREETRHGWWADFKHDANPADSFKWNRMQPTQATWFIPHGHLVPAYL